MNAIMKLLPLFLIAATLLYSGWLVERAECSAAPAIRVGHMLVAGC